MNITHFSARTFELEAFATANDALGGSRHSIKFQAARLDAATAALAEGSPAICAFANDDISAATIAALDQANVKLLALRCAGFNQVDLEAAAEHGIAVARVPAYSPHAVAEHAVALLLTLVRHTHRAFNRVREHNFSLDGLMGFDLHGKTVGIIGAGKIGICFVSIMRGFGCRVLAFDPYPNDELKASGADIVDLDTLLAEADVISLHCPLNPDTRHLISAEALSKTKPGLILINTSRGGVIDTPAVINALKARTLGGLALDVYEEEGDVFYKDLSGQIMQDEVLARLLTFPNVIVTSHQGFLTREAVRNIAETTLANITAFEGGGADAIPKANRVTADQHLAAN